MHDGKHLSKAITDFIQQRDAPCLLLQASDQDTVFPITLLHSLDRQDDHRLVLLCPQPCTTATEYMDAIAEHTRIQIDALNAQLSFAELEAEPLPQVVLDSREEPATRLVALVDYVRFHTADSVDIVWGFIPESLADVDGYREMTRPLVPTEGVTDWYDGHHFIVRELPDGSIWSDRLRRDEVEDVLVYRFEMSHAKVVDDLAAMAADDTRSDEERMSAFAQLAGLDVAHGRYGDAIEKYDALERFYGATNQPNLRALMFGGSGDALRLAGKPEQALQHYRQGLAVSTDASEFTAMLTLLMSTAETCMQLKDWSEAEGYFGLAIDVGTKLLNFVAVCDALDQRGVVRTEMGNRRAAAHDWVTAKELAKRYEYSLRFHSAIDHLIDLYKAAGLPDKVSQLRDEKTTLALPVDVEDSGDGVVATNAHDEESGPNGKDDLDA